MEHQLRSVLRRPLQYNTEVVRRHGDDATHETGTRKMLPRQSAATPAPRCGRCYGKSETAACCQGDICVTRGHLSSPGAKIAGVWRRLPTQPRTCSRSRYRQSSSASRGRSSELRLGPLASLCRARIGRGMASRSWRHGSQVAPGNASQLWPQSAKHCHFLRSTGTAHSMGRAQLTAGTFRRSPKQIL